ncbi:MAG TPA: polysaccharide biosynthesis/export family protein, partial [Longimicrobiales bacterium]|nr:polysaccharide biosynthesis/export family protein [Longimicrobiales bacterium]
PLQRAEAQTPSPVGAGDFIKVGDVVRLWIWREEDMSGDFVVPESGVVVFPRIGERKVTGRALRELKAEMLTDYQKYLRNPSIEITFLRRVNVLGAVKKPGVFPVDPTMTISNVLALAGGTSEGGKPDEVQLFRDGQKLVTRITERTRISELPLQSGDQLFVPERSWAARNTGVIAAVISGAVSVAIAIIVNSN